MSEKYEEFKQNALQFGVGDIDTRMCIILYLIDLSDEYLQRTEWCEYSQKSYHYNLCQVSRYMIEDTVLEYYFYNKKEIPYEQVGLTLRTRSEAEKLYKVCELVDKLFDSAPDHTNDSYLTSPYFHPMIQAAKDALTEMLANEGILMEDARRWGGKLFDHASLRKVSKKNES